MDTLNDIKDAMNVALEKIGYSKRFSYEEAKLLIGSGARVMIERAIYYSNGNPNDLDKLGQTYLPLYQEYQNKTTKPYDGMLDVLKELKAKGYKLYILTNKPEHLTKILFDKYFKDYMDGYLGQTMGDISKPDPRFTQKLLDKYDLKINESLFVGDSNIDVLVGKNVKMDVVLCLYGYGNEETKNNSYPKYKINKPQELLDIL